MKELTQKFKVTTLVYVTGHGKDKKACLKNIADQLRSVAIDTIKDGYWEDELLESDVYDDFPEDEEE